MDGHMENKKTLSAGLKFLAICLALLFVISSTLTIISFVMLNTITDRETYSEIIAASDIVEVSRVALLKGLVKSGLEDSANNVALNDASLEAAADILMPYDWINATLDVWVSDLLSYMQDPAASVPDLSLDLQPMIASLKGPQGSMAVIQLFGSLPECTTQQQLQGLMAGRITCMPGAQYLPMASQAISTYFADKLPARISLFDLDAMGIKTTNIESTLNEVRSTYHNIRLIFWSGLIASVVLFIVYLLLFLSRPARLLPSIPWPLYASVFTGLLLIFLSGLLVGSSMNLVANLPGNIPENLTYTVSAVLQTFYGIIKQQWLTIVLIMAGLTILLHILALIINKLINWNKNDKNMSQDQSQRIKKEFPILIGSFDKISPLRRITQRALCFKRWTNYAGTATASSTSSRIESGGIPSAWGFKIQDLPVPQGGVCDLAYIINSDGLTTIEKRLNFGRPYQGLDTARAYANPQMSLYAVRGMLIMWVGCTHNSGRIFINAIFNRHFFG